MTIDVEYDTDTKSFVAYVRELHGMSTYGNTEADALDNATEMIRGYVLSMEANKKRIPLSAKKLKELKSAVGID